MPSSDHERFWGQLCDKINKRTELFRDMALPKRSKTGWGRIFEGVWLGFVVCRNRAHIEVCIEKGTQKEIEAKFQKFKLVQAKIESDFGEKLRDDPMPNVNRRKLMSQPLPFGKNDKEQWEQLQNDLVEQMLKFTHALNRYGPLQNKIAN